MTPEVARREGKAPVEDAAASGLRREGKAPVGPSSEVRSVVAPRRFMANAWCVRPMHTAPAADGGWQVVSSHKQWRRVAHAPSPPPAHRSVPTDLISRYFNCFREDHATAAYKFLSRYLRCHHEGHQARSCKRPRSPNAAGPPPRLPWLSSGKQQPWLASVVVVNPGVGNITQSKPRERCHRLLSSTPLGRSGVSIPEGPPS
jgi:hypothetical protein